MNDPSRTARDIVNRMRNQLAEQQQPSAGEHSSTDEASTPTGTGEALNGRVRVTVSQGRISEVTLDPRAMRAPSEDLAAAFREAANAAIEDQTGRMTTDLPTMPPLTDLARTLDEISADSMRAIEESTQGIQDAIAAVQRVSEQHRRRNPRY
jgi:DNA-binding protein YbaB